MGWVYSDPGGGYSSITNSIVDRGTYKISYSVSVGRRDRDRIAVKVTANIGYGSLGAESYYPPNYQVFLIKNDYFIFKGKMSMTRYWVGDLEAGVATKLSLGYNYVESLSGSQWLFQPTITGPKYTSYFSVRYYPNGGSGTGTATQTALYKSTVVLSPCGWERTGYHFVGWSTVSGDHDPPSVGYQPGDLMVLEADWSLYAAWAVDRYYIRFNPNNNTGSLPYYTPKTYNRPISLPHCTFTYTDHVFRHWNTKADNTGISYYDGDTFNLNGTSDNDIIDLYAIWDIDEFMFTYKANGGTGADQTQQKLYRVPVMMKPADTFSRNKYVFVDWCTTADGTGTHFAAGAYYNGDIDLTLYAQWQKANIPVYHKDSNGDVHQAEKAYYKDSEGTVYPCTMYYKDSNGVVHELT